MSDSLVTEADAFQIMGQSYGPDFLMTLIDVYNVRTTATSSTICTKISESHLLIAELEYDVDSFYTLIESLVKKLADNGEHSEDIFAHIAPSYKKIPNTEFHP